MLLNSNLLRCPVCREALLKEQNGYRCQAGHTYDIAKEGYVNLLLANKKKTALPGDSKEMLQGRRRFLEQGYYLPLLNKLSALCGSLTPDEELTLLDIGCGEGYFTAGVQEKNRNIRQCWGLDVSKAAVQLAAKKYKQCQFAVASSQELPFLCQSIGLVFNINSPINSEEIVRVLKDEGIYLRISPEANHLWTLKTHVYDEPRPHTGEPIEISGLQFQQRETVAFDMVVEKAFIADLLLMTPYYWHARADQQQAIGALSKLVTPAGFYIDVYKKVL